MKLLNVENYRFYIIGCTGWGPQDSVQLPYFSGFMVDITIVNRGYFMVYKPTYNWGAPSCRTIG